MNCIEATVVMPWLLGSTPAIARRYERKRETTKSPAAIRFLVMAISSGTVVGFDGSRKLSSASVKSWLRTGNLLSPLVAKDRDRVNETSATDVRQGAQVRQCLGLRGEYSASKRPVAKAWLLERTSLSASGGDRPQTQGDEQMPLRDIQHGAHFALRYEDRFKASLHLLLEFV